MNSAADRPAQWSHVIRWGDNGQSPYKEANMPWKDFNGPGGGEFSISDTDIGEVDGPADWILWGAGQDLVIHNQKNGDGSLTLHAFGTITILGQKDGNGNLFVEDDNEAIVIATVNGAGHLYFRNRGLKKISVKDGPGNIYFRGAPPFLGRVIGSGRIMREQVPQSV